MSAEPADGADVNDAPEPTNATAEEHSDALEETTTEHPPEGGQEEDAVLEELGINSEVREAVRPKESKQPTDHEEDSEATEGDPAAGPQKSEHGGKRDGDPAAGREKTAAGKEDLEEDDEEKALAADANLESEIAAEQNPRVRGLLKRVLKQRRQLREARAEKPGDDPAARQAEHRLEPNEEDPFADVTTPEEMETAVAEYRSLREWAQMNPDGGTLVVGKDKDGNPIEREYTPQQAAKIVASTTRILEEHLPRKIKFMQENSLHTRVAREIMPAMFEEGTEQNRFYQDALRDIPGFRRIPGGPNMIRWGWAGRMLDLASSPDPEQLAKIGADKPEIQNALQIIRNWIGLKSAGAAKSNGKEVVTRNPKVAPFMRARKEEPPPAPGVPAVRTPPGDATRGGPRRSSVDDKETIEQFAADGADDTALENLIRAEEERARKEREPAVV